MEAAFQLRRGCPVPFAVLLAALAEVPDPRRGQGQRYSMRHLLLFSVLATLTGATSYQKIIAFMALQRERLNAVFGACFRRAPAVNTLRHLFLALGRDDLEAAFRRHARDLSAGDTASMPRTIALDGKTLPGSFDHLTDRKAVHVLSAFASDAALILAHQELGGAPDEIAAVPKLMAELGLTGVLFTADALHCQKDGFAQAAATGNALLVRVKDNQPTLHATLAGLCAEQHSFDSHETVDRRRHGRQEHRRVEVFNTAGQLNEPWQTLISCVARVSRLTYIKDTRSSLWARREEVGYYPCQTRHGAKVLGCAIPAHWGLDFAHSVWAESGIARDYDA
jgi:predicted transposase YbfD/YdcC